MVVAAAAAVVLGVVGVGVGVGIATAAAVAVVAAAAVVVVEAEVAAAAEVVIESGFHIGICCGVIGFGYGSGMDRDTLSGPAFPLWLWRKRVTYF